MRMRSWRRRIEKGKKPNAERNWSVTIGNQVSFHAKKIKFQENLNRRMLHDKLERMKATEVGRKVVAELGEEDLQNIDADALIQKQVRNPQHKNIYMSH